MNMASYGQTPGEIMDGYRDSPVDLAALAAARRARLQAALQESQFSALVLSSPENVAYATGYHSAPGQVRSCYPIFAVVGPASIRLALPAVDYAAAVDAGLDPADLFPFGRFYFFGDHAGSLTEVRYESAEAAVEGALRGIDASRAGVEGLVAHPGVRAVVGAGGECRDAGAWVTALRSAKMPAEVELLRRSTELAQAAIEGALAYARPGMTEKQVAAFAAARMSAGGGLPRLVTVAAGERSALADAYSTERPIGRGEILRLDVGCSYYGYYSDMARTAFVGEPSPLHLSRYAALAQGVAQAKQAIRPGLTAGALFQTCIQAVHDAGFPQMQRTNVGHGIGMTSHEQPSLSPGVETEILLGGTYCLETPYYEPGWGGMMLEDTGVVTERGFECFSTLSRELAIIG